MHIRAVPVWSDSGLPFAVFHFVHQLGDPAGSTQHQCENRVGGGFSQHAGRMHQRNTASRQFGHIKIIIANRNGGRGPELGSGGHQFIRELQINTDNTFCLG